MLFTSVANVGSTGVAHYITLQTIASSKSLEKLTSTQLLVTLALESDTLHDRLHERAYTSLYQCVCVEYSYVHMWIIRTGDRRGLLYQNRWNTDSTTVDSQQGFKPA